MSQSGRPATAVLHSSAPADPNPPWAPLAISAALLALVAFLVAMQRYEGLAGGLATAVANYWLPVRPNRRPQPENGGNGNG